MSEGPTIGNSEACAHGVAWDVHCCGCHSGFIFDSRHTCRRRPPGEVVTITSGPFKGRRYVANEAGQLVLDDPPRGRGFEWKYDSAGVLTRVRVGRDE